MKFRYTIYGDIYTEEDGDIEKARAEAEEILKDRLQGVPNYWLASMETINEIRGC